MGTFACFDVCHCTSGLLCATGNTDSRIIAHFFVSDAVHLLSPLNLPGCQSFWDPAYCGCYRAYRRLLPGPVARCGLRLKVGSWSGAEHFDPIATQTPNSELSFLCLEHRGPVLQGLFPTSLEFQFLLWLGDKYALKLRPVPLAFWFFAKSQMTEREFADLFWPAISTLICLCFAMNV